MVLSPWGGTHRGDVEQSLCRNDGNALISPVSVIEASLPAPKPGLISLLEGGEDPWIPDVRSPEAMPGYLSPGELLEGGKEEAGAGRVLSVCVLFWAPCAISGFPLSSSRNWDYRYTGGCAGKWCGRKAVG